MHITNSVLEPDRQSLTQIHLGNTNSDFCNINSVRTR